MSDTIDKKIAQKNETIKSIKENEAYQAAQKMERLGQLNTTSALSDFVSCDIVFNHATVGMNQQFFDDYYSRKIINRRSSAVIKKAKEIRRMYQEKYPNINIIDLFARFNGTTALSSVNFYDRSNNIILAVAVYVLDSLKNAQKLEEALDYFPSYEEFKDFNDIYVFNDSVHHSFLLRGLVYLIANRNKTPRTGYYLFDPDDIPDAPVEYKMPSETNTNRDRLNAIFSLIPDDTVKTAIEKFKSLFNGMTESFLNAVSQLSNGLDLEHVDEIIDKLIPKDLKKEIKKESLFSEFDSEVARSYAQNLAKMYPTEAYMYAFPKVKWLTKEFMDVQVSDPFESCFAFFWLMEHDDPSFWCNYSLILIRNISAQLPWGFIDLNTEVADFDDDFDDEEDEEKNQEKKISSEIIKAKLLDTQDETKVLDPSAHYVSPLKPTDFHVNNRCAFYAVEQEAACFEQEEFEKDRNNLLDFLYRSSYRYHNPNSKGSDDLNGVQFLLSRSGIIPPRDLVYYHEKVNAIDKYSDKDQKELLALCLSVLHSLGTVKKVALPVTEAAKEAEQNKENGEEIEQEEVKDNIPEIDIDSLLKEISFLKKQVKQLNKNAYEEKRKREDVEKELKKINEEKDSAVTELAELRSMICPIEKSEKTVELKIEFPYEPMLRHVVFGGATSWLKSMRYMLPNVRFIDPDTNPDLQLLRNADVVWFQSKVISHTFFGKVLDKCRLHNIDFQYLNFNSAEKCAEQLALYDMKKVEDDLCAQEKKD